MGQILFSSSEKMFGAFEMLFSEVKKVSLKSSKSQKEKKIELLGTDEEPCVNILGTSISFLFFLVFTRKSPYTFRKMKNIAFN